MHPDHKNNMEKSRRRFLKTIAASGISRQVLQHSPLIGGLLFARHTEAAGLGIPNKSVSIYVPGGAIHKFWAPTGTGEDMVMGRMSNSYDGVKTQCNFLTHMKHSSAGHGATPRLLSNSWSGDTFDVFMGKQLGAGLPFTYVNLGVHSNGQGYLTREGNSQVPFEDNPFNAFRLLFSGGSANPKTAIMAAHMEAAKAIRNKLAGYEVQRLDDHLDAIADTQRRLDQQSGTNTCLAAPSYNEEFDLDYDHFTAQAKLQADIIVAALQCNLTSSASMAFGNHQSEFRVPELNFTGNYHQSIHGGSDGKPDYPYYVEMRNHLGSLTAHLIQRLVEANIIDATVVVETTDMGHADLHSGKDVPFLIAGGGTAIHRGTATETGGAYDHIDVLHTAAKACGVEWTTDK